MENEINRLNSEWVVVNATREMLKIANGGDIRKSSYNDALELGGEIYPELLAEEVSLIRRERLSSITKEYIQKAKLLSIREGRETNPITLVERDIDEYTSLIELEKKKNNEQLVKRLGQIHIAKEELVPVRHSENQLIFRDAYNADRNLPTLFSGKASKTFELPNSNDLKIRILHPDKPEHITGADLIYEYHNKEDETVSLVFIQYKIWEDRKLYLSDKRLKEQIERLKSHTCLVGLCNCKLEDEEYRFPYCSSFLRPTDALQRADQQLISSGEHIPICKIDKVKSTGIRGGEYLEYKKMKSVSLSSVLFEDLFNRGKVGSRSLTIKELAEFYEKSNIIDPKDTVVIYAQEY
ncbi:MAG: hypothetical protein KA270_06865 [Saprospiraceae bacterium]|nr:hypothetical protein [Saprospiraceae bacterium]MBP6566870.1 hypothetical protein [Saprospiraceae bacterium]